MRQQWQMSGEAGCRFNRLKNPLKNPLKNALRFQFDSETCLNYPFLEFSQYRKSPVIFLSGFSCDFSINFFSIESGSCLQEMYSTVRRQKGIVNRVSCGSKKWQKFRSSSSFERHQILMQPCPLFLLLRSFALYYPECVREASLP